MEEKRFHCVPFHAFKILYLQKLCFLCDCTRNGNSEVHNLENYLEELLLQHTFNVQLRFNNDSYKHTDEVAITSLISSL